MSLHEELSRLIADELPPEQAAALRRRIATEPEVAAALTSLDALLRGLDALPDELAPPSELDATVLRDAIDGRPQRPAPSVDWPSRPRPLSWATAGALAALTVGWLIPEVPSAESVLVDGTEWVSGDALVLAGDVEIELDGTARVTVEPPPGTSRVPAGPDPEGNMRKETVLAGLTGALVTVTVYEGTALVRSPAADTLVRAGETHRVGPESERAVSTTPQTTRSSAGDGPAARIARLERELADTQRKLAESEFVGALARGQLVAHQGEPIPWPPNVPEAFEADRFESEVRGRLADIPSVQLEDIDCTEYPCIAVIRSFAKDDGWAELLEQSIQGMVDQAYGDQGSLSVNRSRVRSDQGEARYVIFGAWDGSASGADDVFRQRTDFRIDALFEEQSQKARDELGATAP